MNMVRGGAEPTRCAIVPNLRIASWGNQRLTRKTDATCERRRRSQVAGRIRETANALETIKGGDARTADTFCPQVLSEITEYAQQPGRNMSSATAATNQLSCGRWPRSPNQAS